MKYTLALHAKARAYDGTIDKQDVAALTTSAQDCGGVSDVEKDELRSLLTSPATKDKFTPEARADLQKFLARLPTPAQDAAGQAKAKDAGWSLLGLLGRNRGGEIAPQQRADLDRHADELGEKLHGFLNLSCVSHTVADAEMVKLGALDGRELEQVADRLGAGKTQRLIDRLSPEGRAASAATVAKLEQMHFGSVLGAAAKQGLAPKDATVDFDQTIAEVQSGTHQLPADAKDYVYLSVPGLITEHYSGYMDANVQRLRDRGLTVHRSQIDTDLGSDANARTLRREINQLAESTGKKVVVLAHSKGGPDTALALRDKTTQENVHLFVAMQPAYGGTPVADAVSKTDPVDGLTRDVLTNVWHADNGEAVADLTFERQKQRFSIDRGNPPLEVTTLSLATTASGARQSATPLGRLDQFMANLHYGDKAVSDGMVPFTSQQIPGKAAHVVKIAGMGHDETIGQGRDPLYTPGDLTEALISVGLRRAAAD